MAFSIGTIPGKGESKVIVATVKKKKNISEWKCPQLWKYTVKRNYTENSKSTSICHLIDREK